MQFPCLIDHFLLPVLISAAFLKLTGKFVSRYGLYPLFTEVHFSELEKEAYQIGYFSEFK